MGSKLVWTLLALALLLFAIGMALRAFFLLIGCAILIAIAAVIWRRVRTPDR
ncbi:hypothetical protein [Roseobacter sp. HKCCA0434]|uniref:hypothetical protein n=1 Tax=Roseobacter sp. HKCCA0434 TaxID=3079297 RepID=UPI002905CD9B|nr:hypothetical protein [Roseobacter sp. HKCCA0434]